MKTLALIGAAAAAWWWLRRRGPPGPPSGGATIGEEVGNQTRAVGPDL